jgi:NarL family two-component system response regulator LiaR
MRDISVLFADDHVITREGIRRLLDDERGLTVIGEASDGEEVVQMVTEMKPDVVIMDIAMPRLNGINATGQIKMIHPRTGWFVLGGLP